ncbi:CAP domain-containing protein [Strongyloides ratti]|uniref:CAP domain-containing protein n=1 Tax=Strongyloides ratti TaxID=34506 RepID=A0A090L9Y4_STRRB|nr:CAP domain-containing protein [Strongyloides ratti]CEF66586.2 CAP domain-containing protein [Strongyloides ratti]
MDLKIFTIVLIYFVSKSHENIFFSVPIYQHFNSRSSRYEYRGKIFYNLKNLIRKVSLDFREVPFKSILLKREYITYEGIVNDTRRDHRYLQVHINGKSKYIILPPHHVVVEFYMHRGKNYFICNKSPFNTYTKARIFCEYLEKFSKFKSQHMLLGKNSLASRIWRNTWRNCYFECFSQNHFEELKRRIIKEIDMLRTAFHHVPIRYKKKLEFIAQHHALLNAKKNKPLIRDDEKTKIHEVAAFISPVIASLQINKWYNSYLEEHVDKNKNMKKSKKESNHFYLLLSPDISKVGVGVYLFRKTLSIVLTFI